MRSAALAITVASALTLGSWVNADRQGGGAPNQSAAPVQSTPPPTSFQLIDRALQAKRIDEETAHKYRVFAAFGDSRLPTPYRGTDTRAEPPLEVETVGSLLDTFSPQTRAELAPFFMRPDEPGSWITLGTVSGQEAAPGTPPPPDAERAQSRSLGDRSASPARYAAYAAAPSALPRRRTAVPAAFLASQSAWQKFPAANGKAKVWAQNRYPGDAAKAQALANALTSRIWDKLTTLMKDPVGDAAFARNGGDNALDIYLVHTPTRPDPANGIRWEGLANSSDPKDNCQASRYLLIDSNRPLVGNRTTNGVLSIAAHELFHAIQYAYSTEVPCRAKWITESTATWAENFVYPDPDTEHEFAKVYLRASRTPIDSPATENVEYGAYLLPYFREMTSGGPDFMPKMWQNFERLVPRTVASPGAPPTSLAARQQAIRSEPVLVRKGVDEVLAGGFEDTWPRFLLHIWNRPPVDAPNGYKQWDRLADTVVAWGARQPVETPTGPVTKTIDFPANASGGGLPYLSGLFSHYVFKNSVRSVVFVNTIARMGQPHKSVWGIAKIRGSWKDPETADSPIHGGDWTKEFQLAWCRDDANEDIEELVIVFGNSDWETAKPLIPTKPPEVKAYPTGCTAWTGTTTTTNTITITGGPDLTIAEVVTSSMRFVVDSTLMHSGKPIQYWKVKSGTLSWRASVTGDCTGETQGSLTITDRGPGEQVANLNIWEEDGKMRVSGNQGPWPGDIPKYTINCPRGAVTQVDWMLMSTLGWFNTDEGTRLAADGKSFGGDFTSQTPGTGVVTRWQYSFRVSP